LRRILSIIIFAFLTITSFALSASAHAELVGANPAADEVVSVWPVEVVLSFNEDLLITTDQQVNYLTVTDMSGNQIDMKNSQVNGSLLSVGLPGEAISGSYFVNYRVVSNDGHIVEDSYEFVYDGQDQAAEVTTQTEPEAVPYSDSTQEEQSSSNLGLILGVVTLASFILIVSQFRKNRYK
jgi:methionine-rich copper-binding protein CopC